MPTCYVFNMTESICPSESCQHSSLNKSSGWIFGTSKLSTCVYSKIYKCQISNVSSLGCQNMPNLSNLASAESNVLKANSRFDVPSWNVSNFSCTKILQYHQ